MTNRNKNSESSNTNSKVVLPENRVVTPGIYPANVVSWKVIPMMFGASKLLIQCDVTIEDEIVTLPYFCNVKLNDQNEMLPPGRRSHLYKLLVALLPSESRERDLDELLGLRCNVKVETSVRDEHRRPKPSSEQFSVIRELQCTDDLSETIPF
jgi:hypothetical protein